MGRRRRALRKIRKEEKGRKKGFKGRRTGGKKWEGKNRERKAGGRKCSRGGTLPAPSGSREQTHSHKICIFWPGRTHTSAQETPSYATSGGGWPPGPREGGLVHLWMLLSVTTIPFHPPPLVPDFYVENISPTLFNGGSRATSIWKMVSYSISLKVKSKRHEYRFLANRGKTRPVYTQLMRV